jgi:rSAM/selenodomain-associated transferase 1
MKYEDTVILVFAKAPVEGRVNTRLIPDLGVQAATKLQEEFIYQRLHMLQQASLCAVTLMCAPDIHHECFVKCQQQYDVTLQQQAGENLGERMFNGIEHSLRSYKYCVVIGTDAPALDATQITSAIETLHEDKSNNSQVVFVPAEDGGYVLVGLDKAYGFLFNNIHWGSDEVMQQSREVLQKTKISFTELVESWDVDRIEDYQRYLALINKSDENLVPMLPRGNA